MGIEQNIRRAGRETKLLEIVYRKKDGSVSTREVEVYEVKNGKLWAIDTSDDNIKQFFLVGILDSKVLNESYIPQWSVKV